MGGFWRAWTRVVKDLRRFLSLTGRLLRCGVWNIGDSRRMTEGGGGFGVRPGSGVRDRHRVGDSEIEIETLSDSNFGRTSGVLKLAGSYPRVLLICSILLAGR